MKTTLLLAFIASTALATGALAQSSGTSGGSTTGKGTTDLTSPSTGTGNSSSGSSTTGSSTGSASGTAAAGSQTENPNIYGTSSGQGNTQGYEGSQYAGVAMGGMMNCFSPAPGGGFGSFACYPTQQMGQGGYGMRGYGMGMGGMGSHPHMGYGDQGGYGDQTGSGPSSPNWYYQERQQFGGNRNYDQGPRSNDRSRGYDNQSQYDNDWRSNQGYDNRYDDNSRQQ